MDAVATDDRRPRNTHRLAAAIEHGDRPLLALLDADAAMPGDDTVGARFADECLVDDLLQVAAVDLELRPRIAGVGSHRLLVDELAEAVEEARFLRRHADRGQRLLQPQLAELPAGVRQDADADADRPDLGGALIDPHGEAPAVQHEGERQPANSSADDDDVHALTLEPRDTDMADLH